jgi:hypothetical protein
MVKPEDIKVPKGMVDAVVYGGLDKTKIYSADYIRKQRDNATTILVRALTWFANNPKIPSDAELASIKNPFVYDRVGTGGIPGSKVTIHRTPEQAFIAEWIRTMFLKPKYDPELQLILDGIRKRNAVGFIESEVDNLVINAYNAGKKVAEHDFMKDFDQDVCDLNEAVQEQAARRRTQSNETNETNAAAFQINITGDQGRRNE